MNPEIILASKSRHRAQILENAGIHFSTQSAQIDERTVEAPLLEANVEAGAIAEILAQAKANNVSDRFPDKYCIGCDQILEFENRILHKPADMDEAARRLLQLSGKSHYLHSAICLVRDSELLWSHVETCTITFRELDPSFVGHYLASAGNEILSSVGAYQIEELAYN